MEIKDRVIQFGETNHSFDGDHFVVDEYGIENNAIYHRTIMISDDDYETFKENPDSEMLLDEFLKHHAIHAEWKRYELKLPTNDDAKTNSKSASRLFDDIDLKNVHAGDAELDEQTRNKIYKKVYNKLSENEALINNPLILNVFNEALKEDSGMATWESVFPFFRQKVMMLVDKS